jgi:hypothetical protein
MLFEANRPPKESPTTTPLARHSRDFGKGSKGTLDHWFE